MIKKYEDSAENRDYDEFDNKPEGAQLPGAGGMPGAQYSKAGGIAMTEMQCELCGGELRLLSAGLFRCASCGITYTAEALRSRLTAQKTLPWEWRLTESGAELTCWREDLEEAAVPPRLGNQPVVSLGKGVFYNKKQLRRVILPEGVRTIGRLAFCKCLSLEQIQVPASLRSIGSDAFTNCRALRGISFPAELSQLGNAAFSGCERLEEAILPKGLREIPLLAFCGCKSLRSLSLPSGLERICDSAFCGCSALEDVELPEGLREIGVMAFWGCEKLKQPKVPPSVERIGSLAFPGLSTRRSFEEKGSEHAGTEPGP